MAAKYLKYSEYADSNVKWLGSIPSHWSIFNGKRLFRNVRRPSLASDEQLAASQKYGVVPQSMMMELNDSKVMLALKGTESFRHVDKNNFVISLRSFEGGIEHSDYEGCVSPAYTVLEPSKPIFPKYYKYLLKCGPYISALQSATDSLRDGKSITFEQFSAIALACPEYTEQEQIANFLDHETAKIDTLIDKQQQLIKLLKEKRQAVISHAVTKGLNPAAPMKESGVEWLGEVPEHWKISPLKFQTMEMQTGPFGSQLHSEDYVDDEIPLINPAHMIDGHIVPSSSCTVDKVTQERLSRHKLKEGDLILARRGELGRCAVIKPEHVGWLCGTGSLKATLINSLRPDYAYMLISSEGVKVELSLESKGSTMENLNTETLGNIRLPVPPAAEQDDILQFVSEIDLKYDRLQSLAVEQIDLLKERRTVLISAAVTGKIDVRNWQPAG